MTNSIIVKEYTSATQLKRFVKGRATSLAKVKEELHLAVSQALFFTAAPHNDVTALNVIFSAFAGQSKQLTSAQKSILEFAKFNAANYLTFDQEKAEFRFKTVRVKGRSKAISEEKRTLVEGYEKMADYRDWLHPDTIAANKAADSVIDADSLTVEPVASGDNGAPSVPKEGAGKGKAIKPLTKARIETFKKSALVTLKMKAKTDAEKEAQESMLALVHFLAKQAGILAVDSNGSRVTVADTELTSEEQKTANLCGDQDAKQA
jgi:hypothetical protein